MVCPKFSTRRSPCSVGSCSTTRALMARERAIISGRSAVRSALFSISASSAASQVTAIFTLSASPAAICRGGSERRVSVSISTARGWWNAPTMFFTPSMSMAVLPPTEESTWASSVVGTL